MPKKTRSSKRKDDEGADAGGGEMLSEEHTIADSSMVSILEDFGGDDSLDTDDYLADNNVTDHRDSDVAAATARLLKLQDALAGLDELTTEKRSATREANLKRLFKAVTQYATGSTGQELVLDQCHYLRVACVYGLRNGAPPEQYAACRVLEAASVVLGADQDDWVHELDTPLRRVVMMNNKALPVRMAALRALSMATVLNASDTAASEHLMDFCEEVAQATYRNVSNHAPSLRATALDCWALLATTIADFYIAGQDDASVGRGLAVMELLMECLDDANVDLRVSAAECFTLIHEARLALGITDEEAENNTARRYQRGSWENTEWEVTMDEVRQRVAALAVESGRHMSKKAKKEQRATFRELQSTLVDDEPPETVLQFRGGSLTLSSWREIIQLNFVRHCLQSGFQIQLLTNSTLQTMFGANGTLLNTNAGYSQLEKRLILSKTSEAAKNADLDLKCKRKKRENIKNHFLTVDE